MDQLKDEQQLTIKLPKRIDSVNAEEAEKEILDVVEEQKPKSIVLDAENMEYISSAGLRVILRLKKKYEDTRMIHVSLPVYEILEMTGFTDILEVKKAMREISIEGCEKIGQGGHGAVYRIDGDTIIKVYKEKEPLADIQREIEYARAAFVNGIPTAIAYDVVKCNGHYGAVFELVNADTFGNRLMQEPEKYEILSEKYVAFFHDLHAAEIDTSKFTSIKELYHGWIDYMRKYYSEHEIEVLHQMIDSVPERKTLVHGDIHPKNIMMQDDELVLIDMADLTWGHPIFDLAGMVLTHVIVSEWSPERSIPALGVDAKTALDLWSKVLKHEFPGKTDEEMTQLNRVLMGYGMLKYSLAPAIDKGLSDEMVAALVAGAKQKFFPMAEGLIGAVQF